MELISEIIFQILGLIIEFLCEFLLQIIGEAIADIIGHSIKEPFRSSKFLNPFLAVIGYSIFGGIAGGLSLLFFADLFIKVQWLRIANVVFTPIVAGLLMAWFGSWRRKHDKEIIRLDTFAYGYCFALSMSLVRFIWGH